MFSPPLYTIRKFTLRLLVENNFRLNLTQEEQKLFYINQSDNMMFRQIRIVTGNIDKFNPFVIFIDCKGFRKDKENLNYILKNGFYINNGFMNIHFVMSEKSASMSRNAILGFINENINLRINNIITMGNEMTKTVVSKYLAYRGLMFSSCFCIEDWFPKVIVVDDFTTIIPNQHITYLVDKETEYEDKETKEKKIWKEKGVTTGYHDIEIIPFDGCGLHHPSITEEVKNRIKIDNNSTSIMWRFPYVKGVTHDFNYTNFLLERGVEEIIDIWNVKHSVKEPMIILTKSMYKGFKYFKKNNDISDWNNYWDKFKAYNHCIGVAKWNFSIEEEPVYTKANYQILQDLQMEYDNFAELSNDSIDWVNKIINGDEVYTYCFLGLLADNTRPSNEYMRVILKNPTMLKDPCVRKYLNNLLRKSLDQFKCGKLWLKATFRILTPDLIMLCEHVGGLKREGILQSNEFYSKGIEGICKGNWLIERNPHICRSEHVLLEGVEKELLTKYCGHLSGITMINAKSITLQKLNSADVDGDLVLNLQNSIMELGIDINLPTTMDMEDKITVPEEDINIDNFIKSILLSMENRIGEYSNVSTGYHNKTPKTPEQKQKYMDYVDLVSILNGKEIDAAKTGIRIKLNSSISKFSKPLPYFMKYAGKYYTNMKKLSHAHSNMNDLCKDLEKTFKKIKFKYKFKDFDYKIMIDNSIEWDIDKYNKLEELYLRFNKEIGELHKQNNMSKTNDNYQNYFGDLTRAEILNTKINWNYYYQPYIKEAKFICKSEKERANYAVEISYGKYPSRDKSFPWVIAQEGLIDNIKQVKSKLPIKDKEGEYEYLGRKYKLVEYGGKVIAE